MCLNDKIIFEKYTKGCSEINTKQCTWEIPAIFKTKIQLEKTLDFNRPIIHKSSIPPILHKKSK